MTMDRALKQRRKKAKARLKREADHLQASMNMNEDLSREARPVKIVIPWKDRVRGLIRSRAFLAGCAAILVIGLIVWAVMRPRVGSMRYAYCRAFLELYLPYPDTLDVSYVEEVPGQVRIGHTHIDPFGQIYFNMIACSYEKDMRGADRVRKIEVNRIDLDHEKYVVPMNRILPAVAAVPPDLRIPRRIADNDPLMDLKRGWTFLYDDLYNRPPDYPG